MTDLNCGEDEGIATMSYKNRIRVDRNGEFVEVDPKDLTTSELCEFLDRIEIESEDSWMPETEKREGYAALGEAIRRLEKMEKMK